jgi:ABC-type branched-subunit amino acid transport system ATPase component
MTALLEVRDLEVSYGHARALNGVTIAVARGSLTAVVGANGAGKTSLVGSMLPGSIPMRPVNWASDRWRRAGRSSPR